MFWYPTDLRCPQLCGVYGGLFHANERQRSGSNVGTILAGTGGTEKNLENLSVKLHDILLNANAEGSGKSVAAAPRDLVISINLL